MTDSYLPVTVHNLPASMFFDGKRLLRKIEGYQRQGVIRIIAGPTHCHVIIDVRRPYFAPPLVLEADQRSPQSAAIAQEPD